MPSSIDRRAAGGERRVELEDLLDAVEVAHQQPSGAGEVRDDRAEIGLVVQHELADDVEIGRRVGQQVA